MNVEAFSLAPVVPGPLLPFIGSTVARDLGGATDRHGHPLTLGSADAELIASLPPKDSSELRRQAITALRSKWDEVAASTTVLIFNPTSRADLSAFPSRRAFNVACQIGIVGRQEPYKIALGVLARSPRVGAKTLLELVAMSSGADTSVGRPSDDGHRRPSRAVIDVAGTLERRRWSGVLYRFDPRFERYFEQADQEIESARDLARWAASKLYTPGEARSSAMRLRRLIDEADKAKALTVEKELGVLIDLIVPRSSGGRRALRHRWGITTGSATTLQSAADVGGLTRERVRQIEGTVSKTLKSTSAWMPAFTRATKFVQDSLPDPASRIQEQLIESGLMDTGSLDVLIAIGKAIERDVGFEVDRQRRYVSQHVVPLSAIAQTARTLVSHWGATTVEAVEAELKKDGSGGVSTEVVSEVLEATLSGFEWLDERCAWFWMPTSRNRLLNQVEKIMSVAGSIDLSELRDGVGRFHRMEGFRPPKAVLARLCESSGLYTREGERILVTNRVRPWEEVLTGNERTLVDVLFEHGPVMRRDDLERIACDERGIKKNSFYIYLSYSPFMARFAPGVFGLRGASISPAQVRALIPPRVRHHRLRDHGWTAKRKLWLGYEVSASSASSGVFSVDRAVRELVDGTYELQADESHVGTLVARNGFMWGLSPFFRRWGVEEGDYVLIVVDKAAGIASIRAGSEELLLVHQEEA
jgi:hypothetical protein